MAELSVTLPEPRPDDAEDVVWGLSTASALWARGERRDAVVWLRRAAEAAESSGNAFRASELGMCAQELEDALAAANADAAPAAPDLPAGALPPPPPRARIASFDIEFAPNAGTPAPPIAMPPLPLASAPAPPAQATQHLPQMAPPPLPPMIQATPHPPSAVPGTARPPSFAPPPMPMQTSPTLVSPGSMRPPPPPLVGPVPDAPGSMRPPPPPLEMAPAALAPPPVPAALPVSPPADEPAPSRPPRSTAPPPMPASTHKPQTSSSPPPAKASAAARKPPLRSPILDPWSEGGPPESNMQRLEDTGTRRKPMATDVGGAALPRQRAAMTDDDGVMTSAAPLEQTLGKKRNVPPPLPGGTSLAGSPQTNPVPAQAKAPPPPPPPRSTSSPANVAVAPPLPAPPSARSAPSVVPPPPALVDKPAEDASPEPEPPLQPGQLTAQAASVPAKAPVAISAKPVPPGINPAARRALSDTLQSPIAASSLRVQAKPATDAPAPPAPAKTVPAVPEAVKRSGTTMVPPAPPRPAAASPGRSALAAMKPDATQPVAEPSPTIAPPVEPAPLSSGPPRIGDVMLEAVEPLTDLPEDVQRALSRSAKIEELGPGVSCGALGVMLVMSGDVFVQAAQGDAPGQLAGARSFLTSRGSFAESFPLRVASGPSGAIVARWDEDTFEQALRSCPWVLDECRSTADRLQSRIGLSLGAMGQLDAKTRDDIASRLEMRVVEPGETITQENEPMPGLVFVVAGRVEILEGDPSAVVGEPRAGELLFADALWAGVPAPLTSRATAPGVILLVGDRKLALDLAAELPLVAELLAR